MFGLTSRDPLTGTARSLLDDEPASNFPFIDQARRQGTSLVDLLAPNPAADGNQCADPILSRRQPGIDDPFGLPRLPEPKWPNPVPANLDDAAASSQGPGPVGAESFPTPADMPQADWWSARNMADVLARKADALKGYFLPQIAKDREAGLTELRAAHAELGRQDPDHARLLADQFTEQTGQSLAESPCKGGVDANGTVCIDIYGPPDAQDDDTGSGDITVGDAPSSTPPTFDPRVGDSKTPPAWKKDIFKNQPGAWERFNKSVGDLPGASDAEKFAYAQVFAAEGGNGVDPNSGASSGITEQTLGEARDAGAVPGLDQVKSPKDLTADQRAGVMRWYFDRTLARAGGSAALDRINDTGAAAASPGRHPLSARGQSGDDADPERHKHCRYECQPESGWRHGQEHLRRLYPTRFQPGHPR